MNKIATEAQTLEKNDTMPVWQHAYGAAPVTARIKANPDDFIVIEHLPFTLTGSGQHVFLRIHKRQRNTVEVAKALARLAGVSAVAVGYAGLKDKEAETEQWFSVDLAGKAEPDWGLLETDGLQIREVTRHNKKLRIGVVKHNEFQLILREVSGDLRELEARLQLVRQQGVPNYFGEQRFGRGFDNINQGLAMLNGEITVRNRSLRGIYYSAIRSFLFNQVLSARIAASNWNTALPGEALILDGSRSFFIAELIDAEILERLARFDVHPSGPLPGKLPEKAELEGSLCTGAAGEFETALLDPYSAWIDALVAEGLEAARRPLRVIPAEMQWTWLDTTSVQLRFLLPAGAYATTVLRELVARP